MTPLERVVDKMVAADMPQLPAGHPIANGKIHRFGPEKKGWYVLHSVTLDSGKEAVWGAFGFHQGENRNTIKVRAEVDGCTDKDRAQIVRKQREQEEKEQAARDKDVMLAANRAKMQWSGASNAGVDQHPYLIKKAVPGYGLRVDADGLLYVPLWSEGGTGDKIKGLQKIDASGEKRYNKGLEKNGAGYALCAIPEDAPVIAIGEGYATCASVHLVSGRPVVVAIDAGNIIHVARALRAAYPAKHLLFLADDDYLLTQRLIDALVKDFKVPYMAHHHVVTCGYVPVIDGVSRKLVASDGEEVELTAWWRTDAQGIAYIEADIRKGRSSRHSTFKNAGVSSCRAAATEVGNASVVLPVFDSRDGEKWTDFNDLQIEQSLDALASQINTAFDLALGVVAPPAPSDCGAGDTGQPSHEQLCCSTDSAPPAPSCEAGDFGVGSIIAPDPNLPAPATSFDPAPPLGEQKDLASAAGTPQDGQGEISAAQGLQGEGKEQISAAEAPQENSTPVAPDAEKPANSPSALDGSVPADVATMRTLEWALAHYSQIYGSTDIWDSLNGIRFKRAAFVLMVSKPTAKAWDDHPDRRVLTIKAEKDHGDKGGASPAGGGGGGGKKKSGRDFGDEFWNKVDRLNKDFALIYGSDEVWDGELSQILRINPLRLAFGNDAIKFWLNNPERKLIPASRVVFDPTMKVNPETSINLFNGFGMKPKKGDCGLIMELLYHLCGEDDAVYVWVMNWLAYPLQNPGAKMASSIIMHGDEGSGKNLFFEKCIRRIYGEYGSVIGNTEIESNFNDWASKKLFMVCDEVVTKAELRQIKGRLKQIISGETIRINPKNLNGREEANHINFVFLSNELQPLVLDKTDRRYMVIWTPPKQSGEYYANVMEQMENGGNEAFYQFLLELDLEGFNEHTKPPMTEAKENLISLGLSPTERFYREWRDGLLPLPYVCCSAMQLYAAFCRWSHLNGERFPATQTMFGRTIRRIGFGEISHGQVKYDLLSDVRQRTVYLVGDQQMEAPNKTREKWVADGSNIFEKDLQKYRHIYDRVDS